MKAEESMVGDMLKRMRTELNLTQKQVAEAMGVVLPLYQKYEWKQVMPPAQAIIDVAKAFNISADYVLGLSGELRPSKYDDAEVAEAFALRDVFSAMLKRAIVDVSKPKAAESVPNAETLAAIAEVERGEGLSREFTSADDLMKDLMSNA